MPHVIVKLWPGKSEKQKQRLADAVTKDVMAPQTPTCFGATRYKFKIDSINR